MNFFFLFFFFTDNLDFLNVNISDELLDLLICLSAYVVLLNESVIFIFDFLISIIFVHHLSDPDYLCFCPFPALPVQSLFPFLYFMVCRIWRRFWFNFTIVVCGDDILCYFFYWFSDFFFSAYIDKGLECCQKSGRYWFLCWICGWVVYIYIYIFQLIHSIAWILEVYIITFFRTQFDFVNGFIEGSAFMVGRMLTAVFWGVVADRYGRKLVIMFSIASA